MKTAESRHESKTKLLDAALQVIRTKGYAATRIEDVCEAAGLSKGSFFHHFKGKEDLALAAADHWAEVTGQFFSAASYHAPSNPVERLLAYVDFRKSILCGELAEFTCLVGTMVQETYGTHPAIRDACARSITGHAATLEQDIADAMSEREINSSWSAQSLALHTQAVVQGSFILAKATGSADVAAESLDHLRRYLELLFKKPTSQEKK